MIFHFLVKRIKVAIENMFCLSPSFNWPTIQEQHTTQQVKGMKRFPLFGFALASGADFLLQNNDKFNKKIN